MSKNIQHLKDNWLKYILEIFVIIIGILGAFALDEWKDERNQKEIEQKYLKSLKSEFEYNLRHIESIIKRNNENINGSIELSNFTGPKAGNISEKEYANLLRRSFFSEIQIRPNTGVLSEVINTGKLALFHNDGLRIALSAWDGSLLKVRFQEDEVGRPRLKIMDMISEKNNRRRFIHELGYGKDLKSSNFKKAYKNTLESIQFDNELILFINTSKLLNDGYYNKFKELIQNILRQVEKDLIIKKV